MQNTGKQKIPAWAGIIHSAAVMALLFRFMILLVFYTEPYRAPEWVLAAQFVTALSGIILGKMWKRKSFWLPAGYFIYLFIRVLTVKASAVTGDPDVRHILFHGLWVIGACYTLPYILGRKQIRRFLRIFTAAWTAGIAVHCLIALYAAWNGIVIWNAAHGGFWGLATTGGQGGPGHMEWNAAGSGEGLRLNVILYCTVSGAVASLSGVIALCGAACEKNRWVKLAYCLALIPMVFVMGLTDTRACYVSFAVGAGAVAGILLLRKLRTGFCGPEAGKGRCALGWILSLGTAMVIAAAAVLLTGRTAAVFNQMKAQGILIPAALAEGNVTVVSSRGFAGSLDAILSGRVSSWKYIVRYLLNHPKAIVWGDSVWLPMRGPNAQPGITNMVGHPHNALLMVLLQNGIPGVALIAGMMITAVRRSFRLVNRSETPVWLALLPAVVLSVCVGDLVECIAGFLGHPYPNCSVMFLCIGIICLYGAKGRPEEEQGGTAPHGERTA